MSTYALRADKFDSGAVVVEEQAVQAFEEYFFARTHSKKALIRKILIGGERCT